MWVYSLTLTIFYLKYTCFSKITTLLLFSLVVFLVLKLQFESFSGHFFIQIALEMWQCWEAVALWQLFCKWQCLLLQILLLARDLILFYGSYYHHFLIIGMIQCYCCTVSLEPPVCQRPKTDWGCEAGSENAAIYWFVCLSDCWHWAGFIIFVFWNSDTFQSSCAVAVNVN